MKENSNPTIHTVQRRRRNVTTLDLNYENELTATTDFTSSDNNNNNVITPIGYGFTYKSIHEKSIALALKDALLSASARQTLSSEGNNGNVSFQILKDAGFLPEDHSNVVSDDEEEDINGTMSEHMQKPNFIPFSASSKRATYKSDEKRDTLDAEEVFDMIRDINDPEHPLTLEQLNVVSQNLIQVKDIKSTQEQMPEFSTVDIYFTPTIPHCSMATLIGLSIRVKILRSLPSRFKVSVKINPGTHASENAINRQLNDKERVAAALENSHLLNVVNKCIAQKN